MPYVLKKKVADAAILTSMLYSSESWLTDNLQKIERHYHAMIKILLGVRNTTANLLCLAEAGFAELSVLVRERRTKFLLSKLTNPDIDEPFIVVYNLCRNNNTHGYKFCEATMTNPSTSNTVAMKCEKYSTSRTKFATYMELNPQLTVHSMYSNPLIPEHQRIATTRFRLSSHNLLVEKLRWSRVPREQRLCPCNRWSIQDEYHVVNECQKSEICREKFKNTLTFPKPLYELFNKDNNNNVCEFIFMLTCQYQ